MHFKANKRSLIIFVHKKLGYLPFLKTCALSLDSSTLPSASMTPGKGSRAVARAGQLTGATALWGWTSFWSCPAVCPEPTSVIWSIRAHVSRSHNVGRYRGARPAWWCLHRAATLDKPASSYTRAHTFSRWAESTGGLDGLVKEYVAFKETLALWWEALGAAGSHMTAPWDQSQAAHSRWRWRHTGAT